MKAFNSLCLCSNRSEVHSSDEEFNYHEQQLERNLRSHRIHRRLVNGDGNCLFYALADGLMYEMKMDPNRFRLELEAFGLSPNSHLADFASRLRQICVNQWRSHEHFYSQFVDKHEVSFQKEVKKFSKTGVSDSTLGDIVPLTIANTFNIRIIIFTSVSNLSQIDIKPMNGNDVLLPRKTIYLAYNQYGAGHYDAAYPRA